MGISGSSCGLLGLSCGILCPLRSTLTPLTYQAAAAPGTDDDGDITPLCPQAPGEPPYYAARWRLGDEVCLGSGKYHGETGVITAFKQDRLKVAVKGRDGVVLTMRHGSMAWMSRPKAAKAPAAPGARAPRSTKRSGHAPSPGKLAKRKRSASKPPKGTAEGPGQPVSPELELAEPPRGATSSTSSAAAAPQAAVAPEAAAAPQAAEAPQASTAPQAAVAPQAAASPQAGAAASRVDAFFGDAANQETEPRDAMSDDDFMDTLAAELGIN